MTGSGGFQQQAYPQPVMAIAGDFSTMNPYFSVKAGPGGLVAGSGGVTTGLFAWTYPPDDLDGSPTIVQNFGYGPVADLSGLRGHPVRDEAAVKTEHSEVLDRLDRLNDKVDGLSTKVSRMEGYLYDRESKH